MYLLWTQILNAQIVSPAGALAPKEIWCETAAFAPRFLGIADGSFVPLMALSCESEKVLRVSFGKEELRSMPRALPAPEAAADEDSVLVNYTSLIQANPQEASASLKPGWISSSEICGLKVESSTGVLGPVTDLVFDTSTWALKYLLCQDAKVKTRNILIDPEWIESVDPKTKTFHVTLSREILVLEAIFDSKRVGNSKYEIDV